MTVRFVPDLPGSSRACTAYALAGAYPGDMASKSTPSSQPKKPSRTLKEKRAAKHSKQEAQKQERKGWETK